MPFPDQQILRVVATNLRKYRAEEKPEFEKRRSNEKKSSMTFLFDAAP
jgi:hypothetical protein